MTEAEVSSIIRDGLKATADFFAEDLATMCRLAKQTFPGFDPAELDTLAADLSTLKTTTEVVDEAAARVLFGAAEAASQRVRASIRSQKKDRSKLSRFGALLSRALASEKLSLGKRNGGDVVWRDVKPLEHWEFVNQDFHQRYLPQFTQIDEGGIVRWLGPDEALALYVTGSSSSGAAFCISVHLWRRQCGSATPTVSEGKMFMNPEGWYDTFVPCCVLHVKAK
jgi:hypothetical protein